MTHNDHPESIWIYVRPPCNQVLVPLRGVHHAEALTIMMMMMERHKSIIAAIALLTGYLPNHIHYFTWIWLIPSQHWLYSPKLWYLSGCMEIVEDLLILSSSSAMSPCSRHLVHLVDHITSGICFFRDQCHFYPWLREKTQRCRSRNTTTTTAGAQHAEKSHQQRFHSHNLLHIAFICVIHRNIPFDALDGGISMGFCSTCFWWCIRF